MFYNPQTSIDRINSQIAELEKLKSQIPSVQPITQNFQLAPQNALRYANNIDEVQKEYVTGDTPFFSKDLSVLWIKSQNGIKTFEIKEIVQKDEKDLQIEFLQAQIDELKKGQMYEHNDNINESIKNEKSRTSKSNTKSNEE
jgi:phosphoribosyl-AMP cyclohydrolase